jgi:branched-chain amino acid transport system ATP-binding protein
VDNTSREFIISTRNLCKQYGGFRVVEDVDLNIRRGSIHALIGPNGAGKTTVFNLLTRFTTVTSGQILFNGDEITHARAFEVARRGMIRSFQVSATFPELTVLENIRVALQQTLGTSMHFWRSSQSLVQLRQRALELLELAGLAEFADHLAAELPYGRKRALELVTTLALDPEMLLLDEPTSGLGQEDVVRIMELIRRFSANRTVLMVEHNLSVVSGLSDVISVLVRGKIIAEGPYREISKKPEVVEAYLGSDHE